MAKSCCVFSVLIGSDSLSLSEIHQTLTCELANQRAVSEVLPGGSKLCIISSLFTIHDDGGNHHLSAESKDRKTVCCSTIPGSCTLYCPESVSGKSIKGQAGSINLSLHLIQETFPCDSELSIFQAVALVIIPRHVLPALHFSLARPSVMNCCVHVVMINDRVSGVILVITRLELHGAVTAQGPVTRQPSLGFHIVLLQLSYPGTR